MKLLPSFKDFLKLYEAPEPPNFHFTIHSNAEREIRRALNNNQTRERYDVIRSLAEEDVNSMRRPHVGIVEGIKYFRPNNARIFFTVEQNRVIILSAFIKRRSSIPRNEIEKAKRRKEELRL